MKVIGIIGAGVVGMTIARAAALAKFDVLLYDINDTVLRQATEKAKGEFKRSIQRGTMTQEEMLGALDRIKSRTHLPDIGHADLLIECVIEDLRVKYDLFRRIDESARSYSYIATTTSTLSVTQLARATKRPERVIGMHFPPPAATRKLVEIVRGLRTGEETAVRMTEFARQIGMTTVQSLDTPGFIVNRINHALFNEAIRIVNEKGATPAQVDRIVRSIAGIPAGPFEQMDAIGVDVVAGAAQAMYEQSGHDPRYRVPRLLRQMVEAGLLGKKSDQGFFDYREQEA